MGSKNKLKRFRENETFPNVIQPDRETLVEGNFELKGRWNRHFGNDQPIILELGCGKGEYTIGLARAHPTCNFIGLDIKGARFWRGAKTALEEHLSNAAFLRGNIAYLDQLFGPEEIAGIWLTFPDPQIKFKRTKHRLTNPQFLEMYQRVIRKGGVIHLKTDSEFMHGYTLGIVQGLGFELLYSNHDIYTNEGCPQEALNIQTFYELQYLQLNKPITYLKFRIL